MAETTPATIQEQLEKSEIVVTAYQAAIDIALYYAENVWTIFNSMLMAHSIIIAATLIFINDTTNHKTAIEIILPLFGIVLCFIWYVLVDRAHQFAALYRLSAQELEEKFFGETNKILMRGREFTKGNFVLFEIGGTSKKRRMGKLMRLFGAREDASYLVILVFILMYIGALVQILIY